jgi:hypothetical protein
MKLSKPQIQRVREALIIAIQSEEAYLQAWRVSWDKRTRQPRRVIHAEERPMAQKTTRRIAAFRKLYSQLKGQ